MKNVEIKAKCDNPQKIEKILKDIGANYKGLDNQIDTYFKVTNGRLKLREGNIENSLIFYDRPNQKGPKQSTFNLYKSQDLDKLKPLLVNSLEILVKVKKERKIFFHNYVKFHIDEVDGLGSFVEIESGDVEVERTIEELRDLCNYYIKLLDIKEEDMMKISYSDMIIGKMNKNI